MAEQNFDFINTVLEDWSSQAMSQLQQAIQKQKLELTDDLLNSIRFEIRKAAATDLAQANFYFRLHGRYKDMKTVYSNFVKTWRQKGFPPIDEIEEFIKKRGLQKFKYVPGYKAGSFPTESIAIRRLAWSIAVGIGKRNTVKAKKWYAKTFWSQLTPLIEKLGEVTAKQTGKTVKDGLDDKTIKI